MTTRDLLGIFSAKREKYSKQCAVNTYDNFIWKKNITDIDNNFVILLNKQNILEEYFRNNNLPKIVDTNDDEINNIVHIISQLLKLLHKQIDDFGKNITSAKLEEEKVIIKNIQLSYFKKLATINKNKNNYLNHLKKQNDLNEKNEIFDYQQILLDNNQELETQQYVEDSKKLLTNIIDVNQLFTDVHILVENQGEMLDNIENNIFTSFNNVEKAHENLIETKKNADNASSKKCAIIICIIIIIMVMIFFIKLL